MMQESQLPIGWTLEKCTLGDYTAEDAGGGLSDGTKFRGCLEAEATGAPWFYGIQLSSAVNVQPGRTFFVKLIYRPLATENVAIARLVVREFMAGGKLSFQTHKECPGSGGVEVVYLTIRDAGRVIQPVLLLETKRSGRSRAELSIEHFEAGII